MESRRAPSSVRCATDGHMRQARRLAQARFVHLSLAVDHATVPQPPRTWRSWSAMAGFYGDCCDSIQPQPTPVAALCACHAWVSDFPTTSPAVQTYAVALSLHEHAFVTTDGSVGRNRCLPGSALFTRSRLPLGLPVHIGRARQTKPA